MSTYHFPRFLEDRSEYDRALSYWGRVWDQIDPLERDIHGWRSPWLSVGPVEFQDGNPMITAVSKDLRKAIRVIQSPPNPQVDTEFAAWIDTFGGQAGDPDCITELVISCVLSPLSSARALSLMRAWVSSGSSTTLSIPADLATVQDVNALYAIAVK